MEQQRGIILIFVLIVMAALLATALGFGFFLLADLRRAKAIDNSLSAYYAADAGIERSLFLFRQQEITSVGELIQNGDLLESNSKWRIDDPSNNSSDYEPSVFRQRLANGKNLKLYFLGRRAGSNSAKAISVFWKKGSPPSSVKLQISFTQLNPQVNADEGDALIYYTDQNVLEVADSETTGGLATCYYFKDIGLSGAPLPLPDQYADYLVEFKVLGSGADYVDKVNILAYDNEEDCRNSVNADSSAISNVTLKSVGSHNNVRQTITANLPPRDPFSGLFGFVLFSEEDITKGY